MLLKKQICLLLLIGLMITYHLNAMEEQSFNTSDAVQNIELGSAIPNLQFITSLNVIQHFEEVAILDAPIPAELKECLIALKTRLSMKNLFEAIKMGNQTEVEFILKYGSRFGITVNSEDAQGDTPLIIAAQHNQLEMIKFFVASGAAIGQRNKHGVSALMIAVEKKHANAIKLLITLTCEIKIESPEFARRTGIIKLILGHQNK